MQISYANVAPARVVSDSKPLTLKEIIADPTKISIPFEYCSVQGFYRGNSDRLIIHIQDPHANYSGQQNLSNTLDYLMTRYAISDVLVEGSSEDVTLSEVRNALPKKDMDRASAKLLYYGVISGEEYLNLTSDHAMNLLGIEDEKYYQENLKAYEKLIQNRQVALPNLQELKQAVQHLKHRSYPKELLEFEALEDEKFIRKVTSLTMLSEVLNLPFDHYSEIVKLWALSQAERKINFKAVNEELMHLMQVINHVDGMASLSRTQSDQLMQLNQIMTKAKEKNINSQHYSSLQSYRDYLADFVQMNLIELMDQVDILEHQVYELLLPTDDLKKIRAVDQYLDLIEKGYKVQMKSKDFELFVQKREHFDMKSIVAFINLKLAEFGSFEMMVPALDYLNESNESINEFYNLVGLRDKAFVKNTVSLTQKKSSQVSFLISGGYHTEHLNELLKKEDISYITLSPKVTSETNHLNYEKLLFAKSTAHTTRVKVVSAVRQSATQSGGWDRFEMLRQAGARLGEDSERIMRFIRDQQKDVSNADQDNLGSRLSGLDVPEYLRSVYQKGSAFKIIRQINEPLGLIDELSLNLSNREIQYLVGLIPGVRTVDFAMRFNQGSVFAELNAETAEGEMIFSIDLLHRHQDAEVMLGSGEFKKNKIQQYIEEPGADPVQISRQKEVEFWGRLRTVLAHRKFTKLLGPSLLSPQPVRDYFKIMGFEHDETVSTSLYMNLFDSKASRLAGLTNLPVLFDESSIAVWYARYEGDEEFVEYVNPTFAKAFGLSVEEILSRQKYGLINPPGAPIDDFKLQDQTAMNRGVFLFRGGEPALSVVKIKYADGVIGIFAPTQREEEISLLKLEPDVYEAVINLRPDLIQKEIIASIDNYLRINIPILKQSFTPDKQELISIIENGLHQIRHLIRQSLNDRSSQEKSNQAAEMIRDKLLQYLISTKGSLDDEIMRVFSSFHRIPLEFLSDEPINDWERKEINRRMEQDESRWADWIARVRPAQDGLQELNSDVWKFAEHLKPFNPRGESIKRIEGSDDIEFLEAGIRIIDHSWSQVADSVVVEEPDFWDWFILIFSGTDIERDQIDFNEEAYEDLRETLSQENVRSSIEKRLDVLRKINGARLSESSNPEEKKSTENKKPLRADEFAYVMNRTLADVSETSLHRNNSSYDGVFRTIFNAFEGVDNPISSIIERVIRENGRAVVADIGAGRQGALIQAKQIYGDSIRTIAADVQNHLENLGEIRSHVLTSILRHPYDESQKPEFVLGPMETVRLPESPDVLLSVYSLPYVEDPLLGFENIYNQLKQGGTFVGAYFPSQFKNFSPYEITSYQEADWLQMVLDKLKEEELIEGDIRPGFFVIRKKSAQIIHVNTERDSTRRKVNRSSEGRVEGDYKLKNPNKPIVFVENNSESTPDSIARNLKNSNLRRTQKNGASKNLGARLSNDWINPVRQELESKGWSSSVVDRLFEEQHVEQLGRDAGFYLDSHMRVQAELLRNEFDRFVAEKIQAADRMVRFAQFGIGKSPQEAADLLNLFYDSVMNAGENPYDWTVYLDAFDKNDLYVEIANEDYFNPQNIDFFLNKIGLKPAQYKRGMFRLKAHLADVSEFESLSRIADQAMQGERADFTLFRNVSYTNREIESKTGDFKQMPDLNHPELPKNYRSVSNLIYHYHSIRNTLLAAAKNGGRYIIDPGLIYRYADDMQQDQSPAKLVIDKGGIISLAEPGDEFSGRSFAFPGIQNIPYSSLRPSPSGKLRPHVFEQSTGIYEVQDVEAILQLEFEGKALAAFRQAILDTQEPPTASRLSDVDLEDLGENIREILALPIDRQNVPTQEFLKRLISKYENDTVLASMIEDVSKDFKPTEEKIADRSQLQSDLPSINARHALMAVMILIAFEAYQNPSGDYPDSPFSKKHLEFLQELLKIYNAHADTRVALDIPSLYFVSRSPFFRSQSGFVTLSALGKRLPEHMAIWYVAAELLAKGMHLTMGDKDTEEDFVIAFNDLKWAFEKLKVMENDFNNYSEEEFNALLAGVMRYLAFVLPQTEGVAIFPFTFTEETIPVLDKTVELVAANIDFIEFVLDAERSRSPWRHQDVNHLQDLSLEDPFLAGMSWPFFYQIENMIFQEPTNKEISLLQYLLSNRDNHEVNEYMTRQLNRLTDDTNELYTSKDEELWAKRTVRIDYFKKFGFHRLYESLTKALKNIRKRLLPNQPKPFSILDLTDVKEDDDVGSRLADKSIDRDFTSRYWRDIWDMSINPIFDQYPAEVTEWIHGEIQTDIKRNSQPYRVIDIGSGRTMDVAKGIYDAFSSDSVLEMHALDVATDFAIDHFKEGRPIQYQQARIDQRTAYEDNFFDISVTAFVLSYIQDRQAAVRETMRTLKDRGKALYILHHPRSKYIENLTRNAAWIAEGAEQNEGKIPPHFQDHANTIQRLREQIFQSESDALHFFEALGFKAEVITLKDFNDGSPLGYAAVVYSDNATDGPDGARLAEWEVVSNIPNIELNATTGQIRLVSDAVPSIEWDDIPKAEFYFVRHGETDGNKEKVFQGTVDFERNQLNAEGKKQKEAAAELTYDALREDIEAGAQVVVIASPIGRAVETAFGFINHFENQRGVKPVYRTHDFLKEISFGLADNHNESDIEGFDEEVRKASQEFVERYRVGLDATAKAPDDTSRGADGIAESYLEHLKNIYDEFHGFKQTLREYQQKAKLGQKTIFVFFGHGTQSSAMRILLGDAEMKDTPEGFINWRNKILPNAQPIKWDPSAKVFKKVEPATGGRLAELPSELLKKSKDLKRPVTSDDFADLIKSLGLPSGSKVASIGSGIPGNTFGGVASGSSKTLSGAFWEYAAWLSGLDLTIFEPNSSLQERWKVIQDHVSSAESFGKLEVDESGNFETAAVPDGYYDAIISMSVLTSNLISSEIKRAIIRKKIDSLKNDGYLIIGWYDRVVEAKVETEVMDKYTGILVEEAEIRNKRLNPVAVGIEKTGLYLHHNFIIYQMEDGARLAEDRAIRSNELNEFAELLNKHDIDISAEDAELHLKNGLSEGIAQIWFDALSASKSFRFPERFFSHPDTLKNWVLASLDSLPGFKNARLENDWEAASEIYRKYVLNYSKFKEKKGSPQTLFFEQEAGIFLIRMIRKDYMTYLRDVETSSRQSMVKLIQFVLPEIIGEYPQLLLSEVERGIGDNRKFISESVLKAAFEDNDPDTIQTLLKQYGSKNKAITVTPVNRKARQYPRIHFFKNTSGQEVHLYHPEKVSEPLDVWFETKQGTLFVVAQEHASKTFLYRAKYDADLGRFVFGAEYVMKWFEGVKGYPFIDDPVLIERQEDNAAHNYYFGVASNGKTVNLGRDMTTRTEAVHSDSSLSVLVVRPRREGKVKKLYAYMTFNQKDPESAVGSWTWRQRKKQLDVDYFLPFGTGAWFESFITRGTPDPKQRYYKRLDLNEHGEANVFRNLKLRIGDLYRGNIAQMPSQVLMVSSSEKHRVDVHFSNDRFSERGAWPEKNQSPYLTSRFYDERQKLFIRPWQELSRRLEAKINDPETVLTTSGIMMQAPSYGRTRLAVIQEHSVELEYALTANQYLWVQPAEIISGENSHTGIQVFLLDDKWNPKFHIRDGYWDRESSAWVWVSESHAEKPDQSTRKKIRTQLQQLDYRPMDASDELKDDREDSESEDKPEIEPEALDRFIEAAIQKLREDFGQDTLLRIDDSMIKNTAVEFSGLPDDESSKNLIGKRLSANSGLGETAGSLVVDSMIRQFWDFVSTPSFEASEAEVLAEEIRVYILQNQLSTLPLKSVMDYISGARLTETTKPLNSRPLNSGARMSEDLDYYLSQISAAAIQAEQYLRRLNEDNHLQIEKSLAAPSIIMGYVRTLRTSRSQENPELFEFFLKRLDTMIKIAEQSIDSFHQALQQQDAAYDDRQIRQEVIGDQGVLRVVSDKIKELREEFPVIIALGSAAYIANEINQYLNRIQPLIHPNRYDFLQTILSNPREPGIQQSLSKLSGPEREFVTLMTVVQWLDDLKAWGATRSSFQGKSEYRILDQLESFSVEIVRYIGDRTPDAGADFNQGQPLKAGQILEHLNSIQRILRYQINQTESGARLAESEEFGSRLADTPLSEEDNPVADSEKPSGSVQIQGDQISIEKYTEEGTWQQSFKFEKFGEVGSVLQTQISLQQTGADPEDNASDLFIYGAPVAYENLETQGIRGIYISDSFRNLGLTRPLLNAYFASFPEVRRLHAEMLNPFLRMFLQHQYGFGFEGTESENAYLIVLDDENRKNPLIQELLSAHKDPSIRYLVYFEDENDDLEFDAAPSEMAPMYLSIPNAEVLEALKKADDLQVIPFHAGRELAVTDPSAFELAIARYPVEILPEEIVVDETRVIREHVLGSKSKDHQGLHIRPAHTLMLFASAVNEMFGGVISIKNTEVEEPEWINLSEAEKKQGYQDTLLQVTQNVFEPGMTMQIMSEGIQNEVVQERVLEYFIELLEDVRHLEAGGTLDDFESDYLMPLHKLSVKFQKKQNKGARLAGADREILMYLNPVMNADRLFETQGDPVGAPMQKVYRRSIDKHLNGSKSFALTGVTLFAGSKSDEYLSFQLFGEKYQTLIPNSRENLNQTVRVYVDSRTMTPQSVMPENERVVIYPRRDHKRVYQLSDNVEEAVKNIDANGELPGYAIERAASVLDAKWFKESDDGSQATVRLVTNIPFTRGEDGRIIVSALKRYKLEAELKDGESAYGIAVFDKDANVTEIYHQTTKEKLYPGQDGYQIYLNPELTPDGTIKDEGTFHRFYSKGRIKDLFSIPEIQVANRILVKGVKLKSYKVEGEESDSMSRKLISFTFSRHNYAVVEQDLPEGFEDAALDLIVDVDSQRVQSAFVSGTNNQVYPTHNQIKVYDKFKIKKGKLIPERLFYATNYLYGNIWQDEFIRKSKRVALDGIKLHQTPTFNYFWFAGRRVLMKSGFVAKPGASYFADVRIQYDAAGDVASMRSVIYDQTHQERVYPEYQAYAANAEKSSGFDGDESLDEAPETEPQSGKKKNIYESNDFLSEILKLSDDEFEDAAFVLAQKMKRGNPMTGRQITNVSQKIIQILNRLYEGYFVYDQESWSDLAKEAYEKHVDLVRSGYGDDPVLVWQFIYEAIDGAMNIAPNSIPQFIRSKTAQLQSRLKAFTSVLSESADGSRLADTSNELISGERISKWLAGRIWAAAGRNKEDISSQERARLQAKWVIRDGWQIFFRPERAVSEIAYAIYEAKNSRGGFQSNEEYLRDGQAARKIVERALQYLDYQIQHENKRYRKIARRAPEATIVHSLDPEVLKQKSGVLENYGIAYQHFQDGKTLHGGDWFRVGLDGKWGMIEIADGVGNGFRATPAWILQKFVNDHVEKLGSPLIRLLSTATSNNERITLLSNYLSALNNDIIAYTDSEIDAHTAPTFTYTFALINYATGEVYEFSAGHPRLQARALSGEWITPENNDGRAELPLGLIPDMDYSRTLQKVFEPHTSMDVVVLQSDGVTDYQAKVLDDQMDGQNQTFQQALAKRFPKSNALPVSEQWNQLTEFMTDLSNQIDHATPTDLTWVAVNLTQGKSYLDRQTLDAVDQAIEVSGNESTATTDPKLTPFVSEVEDGARLAEEDGSLDELWSRGNEVVIELKQIYRDFNDKAKASSFESANYFGNPIVTVAMLFDALSRGRAHLSSSHAEMMRESLQPTSKMYDPFKQGLIGDELVQAIRILQDELGLDDATRMREDQIAQDLTKFDAAFSKNVKDFAEAIDPLITELLEIIDQLELPSQSTSTESGDSIQGDNPNGSRLSSIHHPEIQFNDSVAQYDAWKRGRVGPNQSYLFTGFALSDEEVDKKRKVFEQGVQMLSPDLAERVRQGNILLIGPGRHIQDAQMLREAFPESNSITLQDVSYSNLKYQADQSDFRSTYSGRFQYSHSGITNDTFDWDQGEYDLVYAGYVFRNDLLDYEEWPQALANLNKLLGETGVALIYGSPQEIDHFNHYRFYTHLVSDNPGRNLFLVSNDPNAFGGRLAGSFEEKRYPLDDLKWSGEVHGTKELPKPESQPSVDLSTSARDDMKSVDLTSAEDGLVRKAKTGTRDDKKDVILSGSEAGAEGSQVSNADSSTAAQNDSVGSDSSTAAQNDSVGSDSSTAAHSPFGRIRPLAENDSVDRLLVSSLPSRQVVPSEVDVDRVALASLYGREASYIGSSADQEGYVEFEGDRIVYPDGSIVRVNTDPERLARLRLELKSKRLVEQSFNQNGFESKLNKSFARFRQGLRVLSLLFEVRVQKFELLSDVSGFADSMDANLKLLYQLDQEERFKPFYTQIFVGGESEVEALELYRQSLDKVKDVNSDYLEFLDRIQIVPLEQVVRENLQDMNPEKPRLVFAGQVKSFQEYYRGNSKFKSLVEAQSISIVPVQKAQPGELLDALNQFVSGAILTQWAVLSDDDKKEFVEDVENYFKQTYRISAEVSEINDLAYASETKSDWYQKISLPTLGQFIAKAFEQFKIRLRSVDRSA